MATDLESLARALDEIHRSIEDQNTRLAAVAATMANQNEELAAVRLTFVPRQRFRLVISGLLVAGLLTVSTVGVNMILNHRTTCGLRGVLILARTTAERNPIPPGLPAETVAAIERQREQAGDFYTDSLAKLKILWPCGGEG